MASSSGKMPVMDWKFELLADSFRAFRARMDQYFEDNEITDDREKATKIKPAIGDEGMRRILASGLTNEEQQQPEDLWTLIEREVDASVKINFRVHLRSS